MSSSNVYSEKKKLSNFLKINPTSPKNFYGKTKINIEKFLIHNRKNFDNLIILRLFNIIGLTKNFKQQEFSKFQKSKIIIQII